MIWPGPTGELRSITWLLDEDGWNEAWATAAELCRGRPELAGMIGSSWFYDPPLTEISPRLAHQPPALGMPLQPRLAFRARRQITEQGLQAPALTDMGDDLARAEWPSILTGSSNWPPS